DLVRIESVHAIPRIDDGSIAFPAHADVDCQRTADGPVVLRESGHVPTRTVQLLRLILRKVGGKAEQQRSQSAARRGVAGQPRGRSGEGEGTAHGWIVELVIPGTAG